MIRRVVASLLFICIPITLISQEAMTTEKSQLPYYEIPTAPDSYTASTVAARMIDGLGFRYYWVTDGLRAEDLTYKPSEDARSSEETNDHIYGLSRMILNAIKKLPNVRVEEEGITFEEKRKRTLEILNEASQILRENPNLSDLDIIFEGASRSSSFPFWNLINGPIADALWHCGQVVSFRRASGNLFNSNISVFNGTVKE